MANRNGWFFWLKVGAVAGMAILATGCALEFPSFMDPQGPIAADQKWHLIKVTAISMIVVLPVIVLTPIFLWRYRYSNKKARYTPDWEFSKALEFVTWGIPFAIVAIISFHLWQSTKALDPYKPIESAKPALQVQVVGMDWKWLFIYPELGIASMGEMAFPVDRPVSMVLTSDTVMQSFMISSLAGQIYVMPGMTTRLQLQASQPGVFEGENTQFNGMGFHYQKFSAHGMQADQFNNWVAEVRTKGMVLDPAAYRILGERSSVTQARTVLGANGAPDGSIYFSRVEPGQFDHIVHRYHSGKPLANEDQPGGAGYRAQPGSQSGGQSDGK
jgi:cytochrome o ubiquinol oxidase subunit 2